MSDTRSPGQVAYEAYYENRDPWAYVAFRHLPPERQRAWDAAAQAVQRDAVRYVQAVIRHWNEFGPGHGFARHMNALETWLEAHRQEHRP